MKNDNWCKKKILKARTLSELNKQLQQQETSEFVQASDIKHFENDKYPYQVLVIKKWLVNGDKHEFNKVI